MTSRTVIRFGGLCLAGGALAFLGVFTYLAARFNYPDVLDGPAATVLPSLLATGPQGRLVWAIYALLPLIWIPAGVAAYEALAPVQRGAMRLALFSAFFLLTSIVWLQSRQPSRWIGWLGLVTAASGLVGMFRNIFAAVAPIAALNNYLLPLFMIVLGVALARWPTNDRMP
ncbi:MAG: hypothetical protein ABI785_03335 [Gemmatimonadales bacterium]